MPDYIVCTRAIEGGSFSSEPGPIRSRNLPDKKSPLRVIDLTRDPREDYDLGNPGVGE